jgi:hypothetical protein
MREELGAALASIATEWDKAEKLMKLAEKVRAEVVQPSVNELRYAGRRLVDAWQIAVIAEDDPEKQKAFDGFVNDALFRCHCAQHDAVDATVLFVQSALNQYEEDFGLGPLTRHFPDVADLRLSLAEAGDLIVSSRANRGNRVAEYDALAAQHLPPIITTYRKIQTNRAALEALVADSANEGRITSRRFRWSIIWPVLVAVVIAVAAYFAGRITAPTASTPPAQSAASSLSKPVTPDAQAQPPSPSSTAPR